VLWISTSSKEIQGCSFKLDKSEEGNFCLSEILNLFFCVLAFGLSDEDEDFEVMLGLEESDALIINY
jgi:hypothetical protein